MINFWQQLMILKYLFRKYIYKSVNGKCVKCIIVDRRNFILSQWLIIIIIIIIISTFGEW